MKVTNITILLMISLVHQTHAATLGNRHSLINQQQKQSPAPNSAQAKQHSQMNQMLKGSKSSPQALSQNQAPPPKRHHRRRSMKFSDQK